MADNVNAIAAKLGATLLGHVPGARGGAFGAAKVAADVRQFRSDSRPVRITPATFEKLERLARQESGTGTPVDPLDVAARLLEEAVAAAEA
jgi:hypothetical protein